MTATSKDRGIRFRHGLLCLGWQTRSCCVGSKGIYSIYLLSTQVGLCVYVCASAHEEAGMWVCVCVCFWERERACSLFYVCVSESAVHINTRVLMFVCGDVCPRFRQMSHNSNSGNQWSQAPYRWFKAPAHWFLLLSHCSRSGDVLLSRKTHAAKCLSVCDNSFWRIIS